MIFTPYEDEQTTINSIHKYNTYEYSLLRLTDTMIDKNNIDANMLFREQLRSAGIVDYDFLPNGGKNGVKTKAKFIHGNEVDSVILNLYRVTGKRGDPRFSIAGIKSLVRERKLNTADLLYFTVVQKNAAGQPEVIFINLTSHAPSEDVLTKVFGADQISLILSELLPKIKAIAHAGYHPNSKGPGKVCPKDIGDTLEYLLGISANNSQCADYQKQIELKTKFKDIHTLDTLFTLRPHFEETAIERLEPKDRQRVSAFTRYYGYHSERHADSQSLYITIGSKEAPQNKHGFYLDVNEEQKRVNLYGIDPHTKKNEIVAFWHFDELKNELYQKHPATLWIKAEIKMEEDLALFRYVEVELSRSPQFSTFLSLIKSGGITYDRRGYTSISGPYKGKNHGNAWRIRPQLRSQLFGEIISIPL